MSPTARKKLTQAGLSITPSDGYLNTSAVTCTQDASSLHTSSTSFDYDEVDALLGSKQDLRETELQTMECLVRSLVLIRENPRPQLVIDCIILALNHPVYHAYTQTAIAGWNGVKRETVNRTVTEVKEKVGINQIPSCELDPGGELFTLSQSLVTCLLYIAKRSEPKIFIDCICYGIGHPAYEGSSMETIGRAFGVTKADVHKKIKRVMSDLSLPRARFNKDPKSSKQYVLFNTNTKKLTLSSA